MVVVSRWVLETWLCTCGLTGAKIKLIVIGKVAVADPVRCVDMYGRYVGGVLEGFGECQILTME